MTAREIPLNPPLMACTNSALAETDATRRGTRVARRTPQAAIAAVRST